MPIRRSVDGTRSAWTGNGRIANPDDARRVLDEVNAGALHRDNTARATHLVRPADDVGLTQADISRVLPADPALARLLPWPGGIRRGATVAVVGSTSLVIALLAGAMADSTSWAVIIGMPAFGALAAAEAGVPLERLALVPEPGPDWPSVVSAAIDGVDIVVVAAPPAVPVGVTRALMARARQRDSVLISTSAWPGCDLIINLKSRTWAGLGQGRGRLRGQEVALESVGRGRAARPSNITVTLPIASIIGPAPEQCIPPPPPTLGDVPTPDDVNEQAVAAPLELRPVPRPMDPWEALTHEAAHRRRNPS